MKTILAMSIELAQKNYHHEQTISTDIKHACQEMAEFVQQWIDVNEELPEELPDRLSNLVLTKNELDIIKLEIYDHEFKQFSEVRYEFPVTHWRPINFK